MEKMSNMTDEQLVSLYVGGNYQAFDILLDRNKSNLYSYILYHVHSRDKAEEIFQDTFVKAITTIQQGRYTERGKFAAWLTRIARNLIIDLFRSEQNCCEVSNDGSEYSLYDKYTATDNSIETQMLNDRTLTEVRLLMDRLPENQREIVFMRFYQDIPFKEIAEMKQISINTALGRMHYAINNLRRMADERHISLALY